ncbi:P-loop containing nucleoside triphosphate hydrolase protein [Cladochytrium replicatum]|nr:P-loop containing nucleoside triphosphate hydrolase protein [Cladochytrium replicatum]
MPTAIDRKLILRNKCILLGNQAVGKSAIAQVFHSDGAQYQKNYAMTIQVEILVKVVNIPDFNVTVELFLFDMGGNEVFADMIPRYCEGAGCFVLVYDVTNLESFKCLSKWLSIAKKAKSGKATHGVVVANKTDQGFRRVVTTAQGEEFAKANGLGYFECSAANNTEVDAPFYYLSSLMHQHFEDSITLFSKIGDSSK